MKKRRTTRHSLRKKISKISIKEAISQYAAAFAITPPGALACAAE
jgi:hypothetical protein